MCEKAKLHAENLAALMITYPSTHGVFESSIQRITKVIHDCGGRFMDGANMNAQVGLTNPALIGAMYATSIYTRPLPFHMVGVALELAHLRC
ncbi:MAG: hypothetical protein CM15mP59_3660 [Flavobacteriaceae bacterium]|nr:MAG: hypothetical protein CM15mP59_3660 [Flavobacteriaceae bacterium]